LFYFFILKIAVLFLYIKATYKVLMFFTHSTRPLLKKMLPGVWRSSGKAHKKTARSEPDGFLKKTALTPKVYAV
jgi:hypothetical protein